MKLFWVMSCLKMSLHPPFLRRSLFPSCWINMMSDAASHYICMKNMLLTQVWLHAELPQWSLLGQDITPRAYWGYKYSVWPWHLSCQTPNDGAQSLQSGGYELSLQTTDFLKRLNLHTVTTYNSDVVCTSANWCTIFVSS